MTAVLAEAPGTPAIDATAPRRAVLALARVEMVRMLRHPVTVAATLLLAGSWVSAWFAIGTTRYPVLQELDRDSAIGMMILLGGAALIVGNLAVLRTHRDGTTGLSQVLILPDRARTLAHLLAMLPLAVVGSVLILARMAVLAICAPAAGHPNPYELAIGPAAVLLLGALGVLLGRLTRSAVVAPLALLVLLASFVALEPLTNGGGKAMWLALQGGPALEMPTPVSLMARPAAAHLGYLLGLAGLLATAAVLRAGARGVRVAVAGAVALACTVAGGTAQLSPPSRAVAAARTAVMNHPSQHETCQELGHVTYCALAGFSRWIPAWNMVVQAVVAAVPATARSTQLTVRQRIVVMAFDPGTRPEQLLAVWRADDAAAGTPRAIGIGTQWGDSRAAADLAAQVAYRLVTGETGETGEAGEAGVEDRDGATACGGAGVLVVWLAGQASTGLRLLAQDERDERGGVSFYETQLFPTVYVPAPELAVATQALARPRADIAARVQQSWATLTAPGTTAAQAAQILGVPAPATSTAC
ncbi:hypothetical protein [Nonomuraea basaltis]|uniref:hypothetical protein n=1 Tax=Nonomuraea basaltis TaxID=2495887 RepID=UPI00110C5737|nr:hypothetical protein [Nonomuraea basaltis]TMR89249.1 hypothetical protein EJK15_61765 [Nonomuraea basaltis]